MKNRNEIMEDLSSLFKIEDEDTLINMISWRKDGWNKTDENMLINYSKYMYALSHLKK